MDGIKAHGYAIRFRLRTLKWRKRDKKGKARGFWEGKQVYVRVTGPDDVQRDLLLGTPTRSVGAFKSRGKVGGRPPRRPRRRTLHRRVGKGGTDTRDPADTKTGSLLDYMKKR